MLKLENSWASTLRSLEKTQVMGVLNRTPDSFSDGGRFIDEGKAVERAREMVLEGADLIDIGGESTRPGSRPVKLDQELHRTVSLIRKLSGELKIPISIDTTKSEVAREAISAGATIINDVSGLKSDPYMAGVAFDSGATVCLMHMRGIPLNMQDDTSYGDLVREIIEGLKESVDIARDHGISDEKIILDPGIGFGKSPVQNLTIINRLEEFKVLGMPILLGLSRKHFIGATLSRDVSERLAGTLAATVFALMKGVNIIRTHDVKETIDSVRMIDAIREERI